MDGWHTVTASETGVIPFADCDDPKEIERQIARNLEATLRWEEWLERRTR